LSEHEKDRLVASFRVIEHLRAALKLKQDELMWTRPFSYRHRPRKRAIQ
jgi:hypothetical protein